MTLPIVHFWAFKQLNEKVLGETQTLRTGCSKVEPKNFTPLQTPFLGARDGQNLISWRWTLPSPTDPVWRSMHAISNYHGNRPPHTNTHTQIHRQDRLQYTALLSLARSVILRHISATFTHTGNWYRPAHNWRSAMFYNVRSLAVPCI